ncbi:CdaR family transcriptional regulator [Streptomyces sp. NBC_00690]|uniref:CdaR family transcriptional regulator n=1 Tax=Streptomyces sp. NBC_00690 TaxID=2975808 RepID=UPI002E295B0F|nr:sugar diacid recognition domain-containing protein [Streptomyces sp. NBC_00690]
MIAGTTAQAIVDDIVGRLGVNVNIMDERGVITASGDRSRVGSLHEGARRVLETGLPFSVTGEEARTLHGTRAGVNLPLRLDNEIVGVVGVSGEPRDVGEIARAIAHLAELMVMQQAFLGEAGWRHRVRQQIVEDLVAERLTVQSWRQRQQLAGCRVEAPYTLFVLHCGQQDTAADPRELYRWLEVDEAAVLVAADAEGAVWAVAGGTAAVALRRRLVSLCESRKDIGVLDAGRSEDFAALVERTGQARFAMRRKLVGEVRLSDLELPALLARIATDTRNATAERILGTLSAELRHTLWVYFAQDRSITDAALALNVHRNTLAYRLGRIEDLTSRDPRSFQDAVVLQVALHLTELD